VSEDDRDPLFDDIVRGMAGALPLDAEATAEVESAPPRPAAAPPDEEPMCDASCVRCHEPIRVPMWMRVVIRGWNRREIENAEREQRPAQPISMGQVAACAACAPLVRAEIGQSSMAEYYTTKAYLEQLRKGYHSPDAIWWLKSHGHSREVAAYFAAEGRTEP
jgi:hypothetical protein